MLQASRLKSVLAPSIYIPEAEVTLDRLAPTGTKQMLSGPVQLVAVDFAFGEQGHRRNRLRRDNIIGRCSQEWLVRRPKSTLFTINDVEALRLAKETGYRSTTLDLVTVYSARTFAWAVQICRTGCTWTTAVWKAPTNPPLITSWPG